MKRYLFFFIVLLSFCFNWNRVEAKSKTSREEKGCTGLDHNRFRYYDSNSGTYINKDPIRLARNNPNLYAYVYDSNAAVDPMGLSECGVHSDFDSGASFLMTGDAYDFFGKGKSHLARPDEQLVAPTSQLDDSLKKSKW